MLRATLRPASRPCVRLKEKSTSGRPWVKSGLNKPILNGDEGDKCVAFYKMRRTYYFKLAVAVLPSVFELLHLEYQLDSVANPPSEPDRQWSRRVLDRSAGLG